MSLEQDKSKKSAFQEFCLNTTIHGLPNIIEANNWCERFFWIIVTIGGLLTCIALIIVAILSYFSFEVTASYSLINESPAVFPAITICNIVPFNISLIEEILNEENFSLDIDSNGSRPVINQVTDKRDLVRAKLISNRKLNLTSLGFSIQSLLISCTFNNGPCSQKDFYQYFDNNYGNCYSFNYNKKNPKLTSKYGPKYGFKLELFAGLPSRDDYLSTERGIYLAVTNNTVLPVTNYDGIKLAIGHATDVKVTRTFYSKLGAPYSKCRSDNKIALKSDSDLYNRTLELNNYSMQLCYDLCLQKIYIEGKCNCSDPTFYQFNTSMPICDTLDLLNCAHEMKDKFDSQKIADQCGVYCPTPCDTTKYETITSSSSYPSNYYFEILYNTPNIMNRFKKYFNNSWKNVSKNEIQSVVQNSILKVNVYYEDLSYIFISESASTTSVSVLGTIGGHLGLFIGMSVLSIFEFIEIIFRILQRRFNKQNNNIIELE